MSSDFDLPEQAAELAGRATGLAARGLQLKFGAIAAAIFLLGLLGLGLLAPGAGTASATSCQDTGAGTDSTVPDPATTYDTAAATAADDPDSVHQQQLDNALAIDAIARKDNLPGRATLIALMTALQESSLLNLDHGDADSVGLFQQRPSQGWGTKEQILQIDYESESFFEGRGTNTGLADISGWPTLPLGQAAQQVQHSAHPDLYAGQEGQARKIADEAGIDLTRPGAAAPTGSTATASPASPPTDTTADDGCTSAPVTDGEPGAPFTDTTEDWTVSNPRSADQAVAYAMNHAGDDSTSGWAGMCLRFVATVYGWHYAGVNTALDEWAAIPDNLRHPGDRNPPPGALLFWRTGNPAGHIAVYVGGGNIVSTDARRVGYADVVPANSLESSWGATYLGWAAPDFPYAG